jgi:hypothetical protein
MLLTLVKSNNLWVYNSQTYKYDLTIYFLINRLKNYLPSYQMRTSNNLLHYLYSASYMLASWSYLLTCTECRKEQLNQSASFTLFATNVTLPLRGEYTWLPHRTIDGLGEGLTTAQYYYYPLKKKSSGNYKHSTCCSTEFFACHSVHLCVPWNSYSEGAYRLYAWLTLWFQ